MLESIHSYTTLEEVKENTGFELIYDELRITPDLTKEEWLALQKVDPTRVRDIEFK